MQEKLYSWLTESRDQVRDVCLALSAPDSARPVHFNGFTLSWSREGLPAYKDVWQEQQQVF
jgi:hypothetical protein